MQHNYARKQYPSIQQPPSNNAHWSNSTSRKIRYHEAPSYAQEPPAPYTSNNNFGGGGGGIDNGKRIEITREIFKVQKVRNATSKSGQGWRWRIELKKLRG